MSSTQYIEICSEARDRDKYPNPAEFNIPFNGEIKGDIKSAINPITYSYPEFTFTGSERSVVGAFGHLDGPGTPGEPYLDNRAKPTSSYYDGQILELLEVAGSPSTTNVYPDGVTFQQLVINITNATPNQILRKDTAGNTPQFTNPGGGGARQDIIQISVPFTANTGLSLLRGFYLFTNINGGLTSVRVPSGTGAGTVSTPFAAGVTLAADLMEPFITNVRTACACNAQTPLSASRNTIAQNTGPVAFAQALVTPAVGATNTTLTLSIAAQWNDFAAVPFAQNDYAVIYIRLTDGSDAGGTFLINAAPSATVMQISGRLLTDAGNAITVADISFISIKIIDSGNNMLIYNGTLADLSLDRNSNIIKFRSGVSLANTPSTGDLIMFNSPSDGTHFPVPYTVFGTGTYADGSVYISLHEDPRNALYTSSSTDPSTLAITFSAHNYPISIEKINKRGSTTDNFIMASPTNLNFTRSINPANDYSVVSLTSENDLTTGIYNMRFYAATGAPADGSILKFVKGSAAKTGADDINNRYAQFSTVVAATNKILYVKSTPAFRTTTSQPTSRTVHEIQESNIVIWSLFCRNSIR